MSRTAYLTFTLDQLLKRKFPMLEHEIREYAQSDLEVEVTFHVEITAMGSPGNGWDDPGEGPEFCVTHIETDPHDYPALATLSKEQDSWCDVNLLDEVNEWIASEVAAGDDYDH